MKMKDGGPHWGAAEAIHDGDCRVCCVRKSYLYIRTASRCPQSKTSDRQDALVYLVLSRSGRGGTVDAGMNLT